MTFESTRTYSPTPSREAGVSLYLVAQVLLRLGGEGWENGLRNHTRCAAVTFFCLIPTLRSCDIIFFSADLDTESISFWRVQQPAEEILLC